MFGNLITIFFFFFSELLGYLLSGLLPFFSGLLTSGPGLLPYLMDIVSRKNK